MVALLTYPAFSWLTFYLIEEFVSKTKDAEKLILYLYIYRKWVLNMRKKKKNYNIKENFLNYNYDLFMKYKIRSLIIKECETKSGSMDSKLGINYHFQQALLINIKKRINSRVFIVAAYEKIRRVKRKWYCSLLQGIFTVSNQEFAFKNGKARFDF
uniref:Uncharacterized protein n=1 Tax=Amorphochlora amoebiformis TaxID=1561963 RepID=A0A0H5BIL0_9EUKA|nr:hypothetical protein [Amorphochlora amoebiformis]